MTKNANEVELLHEYARDVATLWDTCVLPQLEKVPNGFYREFRRRQIESFKLRGEPHLDYCMFSLTQGIAYNQLNLFYKKSLDFMENKYLDSFSLEPTPADIAKFSSYIQAKYSEATATIKDICEEVVTNPPVEGDNLVSGDIDHQSCGTMYNEFGDDAARLFEFVFDASSSIIIDNDNH